jgi:hypothetical protein
MQGKPCAYEPFACLTQPEHEIPVIIDTGASTSLTPVIGDFLGDLEPAPMNEIKGLTAKTRVVGKGTVEWAIRDYWNVVCIIRTTAYNVPDAAVRLFSPQAYFQENANQGKCVIEGIKTVLHLPNGSTMEFPYNPGNNLPIMLRDNPTMAGMTCSDAVFLEQHYSSFMSVAEQTNQNLRPAQKELLQWHFKLGHAGFQWCQKLFAVPQDPTREQVLKPKTAHVTTCEAPLCAACQLAKQKRRTPDTPVTRRPEPMVLRRDNLHPGDRVSLDQYISSLPGRLPHTKGKEDKKDKYTGGTIFVDHASSLIHIVNQVGLTSGETLRAKKKFEQFADSFGIQIKSYLADNVPFGTDAFLRNIESNNQTIEFSGVGAHHQNGVAERSIQTVTQWARAMLLHSVIMWPDQAPFALELWPFAMEHAVYLWNNLPNQASNMAPLELFSKSRFPSYNHLRRLHVWGCPAYVLEPKLQDGKKIPKWNP